MSKAVLLSIRPDWVKKIASGDKTVEVRKTSPRIDTPFKCYIYCTQASPYNPCVPLHYRRPNSTIYDTFLTKRIIGEFVCDWCDPFCPESMYHMIELSNNSLVSPNELEKYAGKSCVLYGWHISDLAIYDKPKKLEEFNLTRAPQSWQYVEELE